MTGEDLVREFKKIDWDDFRRYNSMGCSENWYDPIYAICKTFPEDELLKLSEEEVDRLLKLANNIGEALY